MIKTIIFSKDRPLQLDLTLQSLLKNFPQSTQISVLYKASDNNYLYAYRMLKENYLHDVKIISETELFSQIYKECHTSLPYVNFLTDDCIVYRPIVLDKGFENLISDSSVCCFSLRLGLNTKYRSHDGVKFNDSIPRFQKLDEFLLWNRLSIPSGGYFSYPLSVDGHIYNRELMKTLVWKVKQVAEYVDDIPTNLWTPNTFESLLQKFFFDIPLTMICHEHSSVVNSPNNRVQKTHKNSFGQEFNYNQADLLQKYMGGFRLDLNSIDFSNIETPHQELKLF